MFKSNSKNCYRPLHKKRNYRYFLFSSVLTLSIIVIFFSYFTINTQASVTKKPDPNAASDSISGNTQSTLLELPEIASSGDLSGTIVYLEAKTKVPTAKTKGPELVNLNTVTTVHKETNNLNNTAEETILQATLQATLQKPLAEPSSTSQDKVKTSKASIADNTAPITTAVNEPSLNKKTTTAIFDKVVDKKTLSSLLPIVKTTTTTQNGTANQQQFVSQTVIVKKGDTLSAIFKRLSLSPATLYKIIDSGKPAKRLSRIKPGQKIAVNTRNKQFASLHYFINKVDTLVVNKENNVITSHIESKEIDIRQQFASVTIENSLFLSGNKAGLSSSMIMELAQIFGWDIDFALDVRKGDSFTVLYEEKFIDDNKIGNGHILSAEFINQGKSYKAIRYTDSSGHTDYYSEKGLSMRKAFLRTPVAFSRISSRFSYGRKHPILNKIRAHHGVDYAASTGTAIKAVGKGKVIFKGRKGGYGRVIILQHGSKYTTLYAHMSSYNKKLKKGSRVSQGQTIGYVGSSGLATGPHLHYEFRVNGVHRNPLTVPLPSAAPIAKKYRSDFQTTAETLISQLKLRKQQTIALKDQ